MAASSSSHHGGDEHSEQYFPTPSLRHLSSADFADIYEPAEDSFLLMDGLQQDAARIEAVTPSVCVEVGSGSGAVLTFLASMLRGPPTLNIATDINPRAAEATALTGRNNGVEVSAVCCDLLSCLLPRLLHSVDILLFNPPYVPTEEEVSGTAGISASWAGGARGRQVVDRLYPVVAHLLSPAGLFYQVAVEQNDIADIERVMRGHGFTTSVVMERRAGMEQLYVLRFQRYAPHHCPPSAHS